MAGLGSHWVGVRGWRANSITASGYVVEVVQLKNLLLRPIAIDEIAENHFVGIENGVFDAEAFPSISDVDEAIAALNDGGVGELRADFVFEDHGGLPGEAVF